MEHRNGNFLSAYQANSGTEPFVSPSKSGAGSRNRSNSANDCDTKGQIKRDSIHLSDRKHRPSSSRGKHHRSTERVTLGESGPSVETGGMRHYRSNNSLFQKYSHEKTPVTSQESAWKPPIPKFSGESSRVVINERIKNQHSNYTGRKGSRDYRSPNSSLVASGESSPMKDYRSLDLPVKISEKLSKPRIAIHGTDDAGSNSTYRDDGIHQLEESLSRLSFTSSGSEVQERTRRNTHSSGISHLKGHHSASTNPNTARAALNTSASGTDIKRRNSRGLTTKMPQAEITTLKRRGGSGINPTSSYSPNRDIKGKNEAQLSIGEYILGDDDEPGGGSPTKSLRRRKNTNSGESKLSDRGVHVDTSSFDTSSSKDTQSSSNKSGIFDSVSYHHQHHLSARVASGVKGAGLPSSGREAMSDSRQNSKLISSLRSKLNEKDLEILDLRNLILKRDIKVESLQKELNEKEMDFSRIDSNSKNYEKEFRRASLELSEVKTKNKTLEQRLQILTSQSSGGSSSSTGISSPSATEETVDKRMYDKMIQEKNAKLTFLSQKLNSFDAMKEKYEKEIHKMKLLLTESEKRQLELMQKNEQMALNVRELQDPNNSSIYTNLKERYEKLQTEYDVVKTQSLCKISNLECELENERKRYNELSLKLTTTHNGDHAATPSSLSHHQQQEIELQILELERMQSELMEENSTLKEKNRLLENHPKDSTTATNKADFYSMQSSLSSVRKEISHLSRLVKTILSGQEPNMALLIGKDSSTSEELASSINRVNRPSGGVGGGKRGEIDEKSVRLQCQEEIDSVKTEFGYLRNMISDHYAQNYGKNCTTQ